MVTAQQEFQRDTAFQGMELVPDTHRLALMNGRLHDLHSPLMLGDTLGDAGYHLRDADLVLSNPPFGTKKGGGLPSRDDFTFPTSSSPFSSTSTAACANPPPKSPAEAAPPSSFPTTCTSRTTPARKSAPTSWTNVACTPSSVCPPAFFMRKA